MRASVEHEPEHATLLRPYDRTTPNPMIPAGLSDDGGRASEMEQYGVSDINEAGRRSFAPGGDNLRCACELQLAACAQHAVTPPPAGADDCALS